MIHRLFVLACSAAMSCSAHAHLFPKQYATVKVVENRAALVVAVPVSALHGVDDNRDGALSPQEIQRHNEAIRDQFVARFHVTCETGAATSVLTWAVPPQTDGPPGDSDYVVMLYRVTFPVPPATLAIETDLFGSGADESQLTVSARIGELSEVVTLDAGTPSHRFAWGRREAAL